MLRPVRTYERKKNIAHWHPVRSTNTIIREDVEMNRKPPDFNASTDSEDSLEYDPFDTTFDRIARNVIVHPVPQDQISNSSYVDSSSDEISKKNISLEDESLIMGPFVSVEPLPMPKMREKRSRNKKPKLGKHETKISKTIVPMKNPRVILHKNNSLRDENINPNIQLAKIKNTRRKKKIGRENLSQKKYSVLQESTIISSPRGKKRKNFENSHILKECSICLERLNIPLDKSLNLTQTKTSKSKKINLDSSVTEESRESDKSNEIQTNHAQSEHSTDFSEESSMTIEFFKFDKEKIPKLGINPVVSLPKLNISKESLLRDFSSSTPIVARITKDKSSIRLSPIKNNITEDNDETNNSGIANLPPKSIVQAINAVSENSANFLSLKSKDQNMEKSMKRLTGILSVTPATETSGLLFDDTEITKQKSVSSIIIDSNIDSHLTEFERDSTDPESLKLIFDDNDEVTPKDMSKNVETLEFLSRNSSISNDNHNETMKTSTGDPFMGFSGVQTDNSNDINEKSHNSEDDWSTISGSLNITNGKSISETRSNIEQLSSSGNTLSDEISKFVTTSEISNSHVDTVGKSLIDVNNSSTVERSVSETKNVEKTIDSYKDNRRGFQPVVMLSRLMIDEIPNIKNTKDSRNENFSGTLNSILRLNLNETTNESSMKTIEIFDDTDESQIEMDCLKLDESSDDLTESEKSFISKSTENNYTKYKENFSMENYSNVNNVSSNSVEHNKSDELPKYDENSKSQKSMKNESQDENSQVKEIFENSFSREIRESNVIQPIVLLTRLNDPFRITKRRNKYHNWDFKLSAISEDNVKKVSNADKENMDTDKIWTNEINKDISRESNIKMNVDNLRVSNQIESSQKNNDNCGTTFATNQQKESKRDDKVVFLKPGKSWARSLSILTHVHSQEDLEYLAVGKGRKWRESVQNILGMQQGLVQSCIKKNEDNKELSLFDRTRNSTTWIPGSSQPDTNRLFSISSPGRFIRRVSIRVVPDCKSFDHVKDTSFLEAYGITQNESTQTIASRDTLLGPKKTLDIVPNVLNHEKSKDVVLAQCGQKSSLPFDECYPESYLENCRKIGEGVYGEVFLYEKDSEKNVIKIIPIEGEMKINSERQKKFDEILSEIVIAKELHNLRFTDKSNTNGFVEVKNIKCVFGKYPKKLVDLWKTFDEEKNSENDCPSIFEENQLYIILELGHGGEDLEAYVFQNAGEAYALFMQTALALAVAEESLEFEHRDLHWGNLLISRTNEPQIDFKLNDKLFSVKSKGVKVSVIDFTLSRMSYQGCSIFNDLSMDDDLFVAQGEYQFDIYRFMRNKLENNWQRFEPYTNILWLHYILDKMITAVRYRRKNTKIHKSGISKLQELKKEILKYKSAVDFVMNCDKMVRLQESRTSVSTVASSS